MIGTHRTFQIPMAVFMVLVMPMCCCFSSAWATDCCSPEQAQVQTQIQRSHDHGHHHHDEKNPEGDHDQDKPVPTPEHDESCDCTCDSTMDRTPTTEVSGNFLWTAVTIQGMPWDSLPLKNSIENYTLRQGTLVPLCNSLLRQCSALNI